MKRFRNLVIGGIQTKVFNLILLTVILLSGAIWFLSNYQANILKDLADESNLRQQESIQAITDSVMESVIDQSMSRSTRLEAELADDLFDALQARVRMLGEYAGKLFADPSAYPRLPFKGPDAAENGKIAAQLMLADGVDGNDPSLVDRLGLTANMSDMMVSLFGASEETNSCFIALPDGAFLVTDDRSAAKFDETGSPFSYDPRTRPWYQQAVEKGELIFTDVEVDAFTGDIGVVCAMPVYVNGRLAAVVGSDLFLTSMRDAVLSSQGNGNFVCVVNQNGHVVFSPKEEGIFRVIPGAQAADLRQTDNAALAALVSDAMLGQTDLRLLDLPEGPTYVTGAPVKTVGWALLSLCSQEAAAQPAALLRQSSQQIQDEAVSTYTASSGRTRMTATFLLLGVMALMLAAALILAKRIVAPLNTITKRISELKEGNLEFKMEDAYRTGDEIEELAESFANISHKTVQYVETVKTVTAEKERIGTELSLATQIQAAMLPHIFPPFPGRTEFDIYASMDPAKEVGGDFFDYFLIDDDHLCMVVADVSGKGVPGALFMMASKIIIQSNAMKETSPAEILRLTNETICSNNEAEMFVTVWLGILEISTGRLTAANAGHEYPVIKQPGKPYELYKDKHGFVIGGMPGVRYKDYTLELQPGARLFAYTDGAAEATNANNEMFGTKRIVNTLNEVAEAEPKEVLEHVSEAVEHFVQSAPQFDDLTMLCVEYRGKKQPS